MVDEEKKIPDPIDIDGIQIGEDRFRIKSNLDLNRRENSIIGLNSVARSPEKDVLAADGQDPQDATAVASGIGSYALGPGAIAQGHYSFAIGSGANAIGNDSFCHAAFGVYGNNPTASLINHYPYGRALGEGSVSFNRGGALADYSFAEGVARAGTADSATTDGGLYSHAEGASQTRGDYSHAEGSGIAEGMYSHAEGAGRAGGDYSHAEGSGVGVLIDAPYAKGNSCHAEGIGTFANGYASHAEGYGSIANGYYCHAQGQFSQAGGEKEDTNFLKYVNCTAIGQQVIAKGKNTTVFGDHTAAIEDNQFVIGKWNIPKMNTAFIVGGGINETDEKKNILEFDWNGNLWINGSFSYGEDNKPIDFNNYYTKTESDEKFSTKEEIKNKLLPSVSASDNGKILMVENGAWAATVIVNSEEVAY